MNHKMPERLQNTAPEWEEREVPRSSGYEERLEQIHSLADEGRDARDGEKIERAMREYIKLRLLKIYGVDDLSHIEETRLNDILRQCAEEEKEETRLARRGEISSASVIDPEREVPERWLLELYGILDKELPWQWEVYDAENKRAYNFHTKEEADNKFKELSGSTPFSRRVHRPHRFLPDDVKEYIRRMRENAHLI